MMSNKTRKHYTEEFRAQAVELLRTGKPVSELAEELCVSTDLLYRWRRGTQVGSEGRRAVGEHSGADDLRALLRENAQLRMENDILKKAAIILGTRNPHNSAK
jgi:transposase